MGDRRYRDKQWLEDKYVYEKYTCQEIAELCGVSTSTIYYWQDKFGIERRNKNWKRANQPAQLEHKQSGHERVRARVDGVRKTVGIHQLCAIAWNIAKPEELFGERKIDIHHDNEIPWDNRPENLEKKTRGEHMKEHGERRGGLNGG